MKTDFEKGFEKKAAANPVAKIGLGDKVRAYLNKPSRKLKNYAAMASAGAGLGLVGGYKLTDRAIGENAPQNEW